LESVGILIKAEHPESKAKFQYKLTPKGIDLMPVLFEIVVWSDKYLEISDEGKSLSKKIINNKDNLINRILSRLNK
jgi:DNA-binding HxlR family transcriptional regulator